MKNYNIVYSKQDQTKYAAIVYSSSYINPLDNITEISTDLSQNISSHKPILFDLLLSNGESFNRFVEGFFDGESISFDSLKVVSIKDDTFLKNINSYYKSNKRVLNDGILTARQRFKYAKN